MLQPKRAELPRKAIDLVSGPPVSTTIRQSIW
jgi:hypothetical protein